jgi:hypothetical protein
MTASSGVHRDSRPCILMSPVHDQAERAPRALLPALNADSARLLVMLLWHVAERRLTGSGRHARGGGLGRGRHSRWRVARPRSCCQAAGGTGDQDRPGMRWWPGLPWSCVIFGGQRAAPGWRHLLSVADGRGAPTDDAGPARWHLADDVNGPSCLVRTRMILGGALMSLRDPRRASPATTRSRDCSGRSRGRRRRVRHPSAGTKSRGRSGAWPDRPPACRCEQGGAQPGTRPGEARWGTRTSAAGSRQRRGCLPEGGARTRMCAAGS